MTKTQSFILTLLITMVLSVMWLFLMSGRAQAQLLNDWDPGFKIGPNGEILAPFYDPSDPKISEDNVLFDLYAPDAQNSGDISQPHRTDRQIGEWVAAVFVENIDLNAQTLRSQLSKSRPYFSDKAWQDLSEFLKSDGRLARIQKGEVALKVLERRKPQVIKTKPHPRVFNWVIRLPILMEFRVGERAGTREVDLLVQVIRVPLEKAPDREGILIQGMRRTEASG